MIDGTPISDMAAKEQEIEYTLVANGDLAKQLVREKTVRQRSVDAIAERLKGGILGPSQY
jgi:hypothetical protein